VFPFLYIFPWANHLCACGSSRILQPFKRHHQYSIHAGVQPHCWIAVYTSVTSLVWLSIVFDPLITFWSLALWTIVCTIISILPVPLPLSPLCLCFSLSLRGSTRTPANPGRLTSRPRIEPQCAVLGASCFCLPLSVTYDPFRIGFVFLLGLRKGFFFSVWLLSVPSGILQRVRCFVCVRPWLRPANATVI